jgi:hypothetical protein
MLPPEGTLNAILGWQAIRRNSFRPPEGTLNAIRFQCDAVIEQCEEALQSPLITDDGVDDSAEARHHLQRTLKAASDLRKHLDASYDFIRGFAELKECDANAAD